LNAKEMTRRRRPENCILARKKEAEAALSGVFLNLESAAGKHDVRREGRRKMIKRHDQGWDSVLRF
jgi:hypothetical protein